MTDPRRLKYSLHIEVDVLVETEEELSAVEVLLRGSLAMVASAIPHPVRVTGEKGDVVWVAAPVHAKATEPAPPPKPSRTSN